MEENRISLPVKVNNLKEQLPMVSEEMARHLTALPEELRRMPAEYDYEAYIEHGEKLIESIEKYQGQTEIEFGAMLIAIRTISGEEKWHEAICRWGMTLKTAQIFMKNTRDFGENPELIEGMGYNKISRMGSLPEEVIGQLKISGSALLPDGTEISMTAFKAMTFRELNNEVINIKNQYNKKFSASESKRISAEAEIKTIRGQAKELEEYIKELEENADTATAKKITALEEKLSKTYKKIDRMEIELQDRQAEIYTGEEVGTAAQKACIAIEDVVIKYNNIKPGQNMEARYEVSKLMNDMKKFATRLLIKESNDREELNDNNKRMPENYDEDGYFEPPDL